MGEFYKILTSKKEKVEIKESVWIQPLESYETIIAAVNYALAKSEEVEDMCKEMSEEMNECTGVEVNPRFMMYPMLIATYPTFCLFEIGQKSFKAPYTYDKTIRKATLGIPEQVIVDVQVNPAPIESEDD